MHKTRTFCNPWKPAAHLTKQSELPSHRKMIAQGRHEMDDEEVMQRPFYSLIVLLLGFHFFNIHAQSNPPVHSQLWGKSGEQWHPTSRLPDFSFAGYGRGEEAIPFYPQGVSVHDFGATGDGRTDDTKAFQNALQEVKSGAIEVPAGRYVITGFLEIKRSGALLRGAGPDKTILHFPTPLNDIKPNWGATTSGRRTSNYSWSGGFINIRGSFQSRTLSNIVGTAKRGSNQIQVTNSKVLKVGQEVEIYQRDKPDNSLAIHLYSGDSGPVNQLKGRAKTSLITKITALNGNSVTLERPLRCDLQPQWKPQIRSFDPTVTESGVESMSFEFPVSAYEGHFTELGFNPIALSGVAHCWVRNIRIHHAESGPFVHGYFNTIDRIVFESGRPPDNQQCTGHHGISLSGGDNLVTNFDFRTRFIHDITVSGFTTGNVVMNGCGIDLSLDHHRKGPYANLFTHLDAGEGNRFWKCGGGADLGKHCGTRGTFWCVRSKNPITYPRDNFGPETMNLVGLQTNQPSVTENEGKWFEAISPETMEPKNLYNAQLNRRLKQ